MLGGVGTPHTPLTRCVISPRSLKKSFGRSRVATITVLPLVSSTALLYGSASSVCQFSPSSEKWWALTWVPTHVPSFLPY